MLNEEGTNREKITDQKKNKKLLKTTSNYKFIIKPVVGVLLLLVVLSVAVVVSLVLDKRKFLPIILGIVMFMLVTFYSMLIAIFFLERRFADKDSTDHTFESAEAKKTRHDDKADQQSSYSALSYPVEQKSIYSSSPYPETINSSLGGCDSDTTSSAYKLDDKNDILWFGAHNCISNISKILSFSDLCKLIDAKKLRLDVNIAKAGNFSNLAFDSFLSLFMLLALFWCSNREQRFMLQANFRHLYIFRDFGMQISLEEDNDIKKCVQLLSKFHPLGEKSKIEIIIPVKPDGDDVYQIFEKNINAFKSLLTDDEKKYFSIRHNNSSLCPLTFYLKSDCSTKFSSAYLCSDSEMVEVLGSENNVFVDVFSKVAMVQNLNNELIFFSHEPITDEVTSDLMKQKDQDDQKPHKDSVVLPLYSINEISEQYFALRKYYQFTGNGSFMVHALLKGMHKIFYTIPVSDLCLKMEQNQSLDCLTLSDKLAPGYAGHMSNTKSSKARNFVCSKEKKLYVTLFADKRRFETIIDMPKLLQSAEKVYTKRKGGVEVCSRKVKGYIQSENIDCNKREMEVNMNSISSLTGNLQLLCT